MDYTPGHFPKETPAAIIREFHAVSEGMGAPVVALQFSPSAVEPPKPRDGMTVKAVAPWDPGYGYGPYMHDSTQGWVPMFGAAVAESVEIALGGVSSNISTGLKETFWWPYPVEIDEVFVGARTAPVGSSLIVDVKTSAGASIFSVKPEIQSGEETSLTGVEAVLSSASFSKGDRLDIYVDQIGSTTAGAGVRVVFVFRHVS